MLFQVENINGLYIIPNVLTDDENDFYMQILKNDSYNICSQIHTATEHGWKFLPVRENNKILKRKDSDYLGFPDWLKKLRDIVLNNIKNFFKDKDFNINHALINKYEIGDECHDHTDDLEFWTDFVIGVSFGSYTVMKFCNDDYIIDLNIPKCSVYIMLNDARYKWNMVFIFKKMIIYTAKYVIEMLGYL
jgi:alkylated DNA repair dioxygenase AlkB